MPKQGVLVGEYPPAVGMWASDHGPKPVESLSVCLQCFCPLKCPLTESTQGPRCGKGCLTLWALEPGSQPVEPIQVCAKALSPLECTRAQIALVLGLNSDVVHLL